LQAEKKASLDEKVRCGEKRTGARGSRCCRVPWVSSVRRRQLQAARGRSTHLWLVTPRIGGGRAGGRGGVDLHEEGCTSARAHSDWAGRRDGRWNRRPTALGRVCRALVSRRRGVGWRAGRGLAVAGRGEPARAVCAAARRMSVLSHPRGESEWSVEAEPSRSRPPTARASSTSPCARSCVDAGLNAPCRCSWSPCASSKAGPRRTRDQGSLSLRVARASL